MNPQKKSPIPKRYYSRWIFFLVEVAYWTSFCSRWRSEKEPVLGIGIYCVMAAICFDIMIILLIVDLYTPFHVLESLPPCSSGGVITAKYKWVLGLTILPFCFLLGYFIRNWIYKRASKKELFGYFKKMPPRRRFLGKAMFVIYYFSSQILVLFFISIYVNKMYPGKDQVSPDIKHRLELILKEIKEENSADTINSY